MTDGWPFLVARGRRQGYRARLVPSVLRDLGTSGLVEDSTGEPGGADGAPAVVRHVTTAHGSVAIAYRHHRVRPDEIGVSGPLHDEHSRPIEIIYGFVCLDASINTVADADLDTARQEAMRTFQQFLADENRFVTETSRPFELRSTVVPTRPAAPPQGPGRRIALVLGAVAVVAAGAATLLVLNARPATSVADLAGTWTGALTPVNPGGPEPRQITLAIRCPDNDCTRPGLTGTLTDATCDYALDGNTVVDNALRVTVTPTPIAAGCLPSGSVSLQRRGDALTLLWNAANDPAPLMRAPTLTREATRRAVPRSVCPLWIESGATARVARWRPIGEAAAQR